MQVCEPIRICYLNSLLRYCKNVCDCNIILKRINGIVKERKLNKIANISTYYTNIFIKKNLGGGGGGELPSISRTMNSQKTK